MYDPMDRSRSTVPVKTCTRCKETKPFNDFSPRKSAKDGYRSNCKECDSEYTKNYRVNNPYSKTGNKDWQLKTRFGITLDEYNNILTRQYYRCAICGTDSTHFTRGLAVDHCHITDTIRGLLCINCNTGIGSFKDSPALLEAAIEYLSRDRSNDADGKA